MDVRTALVRMRDELNMRQTDLATALGVTYVTVNRWETGKNVPSRAMSLAIIAFASAHGVSKVCQAALEDALIKSSGNDGIDSLKNADVAQINSLVNNSSNTVMVCDAKTHELLYVNRQAGKITGQPVEQAQGQKCHQYFLHRDTPCEDCPMKDCGSDDFFTMEYKSPVTGRHYMRRSKMVTWSGKKAHLEYITDITELRKAGKALERSHELTRVACKEAEMWLFTLDIQTGAACLEPMVSKALRLPETVPGFVEKLIRLNIVCPMYADGLRQVLPQLKHNISPVEFEGQTNFPNERNHWVRLRATIVDRDERGAPATAVCSAQLIDREKAIETRIQFEHEKIIGSRKDLMGYSISDITQNKVVESRRLMDRGPNTYAGHPYDAAIRDVLAQIEPAEDKKIFMEKHQRALLLRQFEQGQLEQTLEYQLLQPDGTRIWAHAEMRLMPHPSTGSVLLYEYCYAVHTRKILSGLLKTIFRNGYDTVAAISLENDQVARLQFTDDGELKDQELLFASYTKETQAYCANYVVPEERGGFLRAMELSRVCKELENKNTYRVAYHELTANGAFRTMVSEYTLCDRKYQFCLLSVWDQEAMRASINHIADATSEALK